MKIEKTAEQMFKELKYKKVKIEGYNENFLFYKGKVANAEQFVRFYIPEKHVSLIIDSYYLAARVDMKLLQAINQQCKELGWLE